MEDGMESFFLAETAKYLFLLFSNATAVLDHFVLSTEGHLLPVLPPVPKEPLARTVHDVHAESALLTQVSSERCPLLWRQQECADVCRRKTQQLLKSEVCTPVTLLSPLIFEFNLVHASWCTFRRAVGFVPVRCLQTTFIKVKKLVNYML